MRRWIPPLVLSLVLSAGIFALALEEGLTAENKGAEEIRLNSQGSRGVVTFPHRRHQDTIGDCRVCHQRFPQEPGAIDRLKAENKLAQKEIMKKLCIKCHRSRKAAGEAKYGPTTCSKCHQR